MALVMTITIIPSTNAVYATPQLGDIADSMEYLTDEQWLEIEAQFDFLLPMVTCEYEALRNIIDELSDEAFELFISFVSFDEALLAIYQAHVDPSFQPLYDDALALMNADVQILTNLSALLAGLGLGATTVAKLMTVASAILAITFITAVVILAALTAHAVYSFFVGEWGGLRSSWTAIRGAFSTAFAPRVSSSVVNTGFNNANTQFGNSFLRNVADNLEEIFGMFGFGQCVQAANVAITHLRNRGLEGERMTLNFPTPPFHNGEITSRIHFHRNIGHGMHTGVFVRELQRTFCNVHTQGLARTVWVQDFFAIIDIVNNITRIGNGFLTVSRF